METLCKTSKCFTCPYKLIIIQCAHTKYAKCPLHLLAPVPFIQIAPHSLQLQWWSRGNLGIFKGANWIATNFVVVFCKILRSSCLRHVRWTFIFRRGSEFRLWNSRRMIKQPDLLNLLFTTNIIYIFLILVYIFISFFFIVVSMERNSNFACAVACTCSWFVCIHNCTIWGIFCQWLQKSFQDQGKLQIPHFYCLFLSIVFYRLLLIHSLL